MSMLPLHALRLRSTQRGAILYIIAFYEKIHRGCVLPPRRLYAKPNPCNRKYLAASAAPDAPAADGNPHFRDRNDDPNSYGSANRRIRDGTRVPHRFDATSLHPGWDIPHGRHGCAPCAQ